MKAATFICFLWTFAFTVLTGGPAAAQSYSADYRDSRPELIEQVPTNQEIIDGAIGDDDYERDAYRAAAFQVLIEATNAMQGSRYFTGGQSDSTAAELAVNERLRAGLDQISDQYEPGQWWNDKLRIKQNYRRHILERYFPEYLDWRADQGNRVPPDPSPLPPLREADGSLYWGEITGILVATGASALLFLLATLLGGWRPKSWKRDKAVYITAAGLAVLIGLAAATRAGPPFALVGLFLIGGFIFGRFRRKVVKKEDDQQKRAARAQELLRACTGLSGEDFEKADIEERREAILEHFQNDLHAITVESGFRKKQKYVGTMDDAELPGGIKEFTIERGLKRMLNVGRYLKANALLFNEGLIADKTFDVRGFSLLFQDGTGQLQFWKAFEGFEHQQEVRSSQDAFAWIMRRHYMSLESVFEATDTDLGKFLDSHPDNEGVEEAAGMVIGG